MTETRSIPWLDVVNGLGSALVGVLVTVSFAMYAPLLLGLGALGLPLALLLGGVTALSLYVALDRV
ncbi:hypothetical protein [Haloarchaeobius sp. FL176]|uniref:hypothetical protein n=1 Tax=Haloarchaeobius sp. FL176 TaxID=2967129 RepID=UPI002149900A|nr:hypothetical protein [Haloarchaeobius sp. FL176]